METPSAMKIYAKDIAGHTYYYAQRSCRVKLDPADKGKTKGSGKSRVRSEMIYLGSAEQIAKARRRAREAAVEFGKTQGVDIFRELGANYIDLWIGKIVRRLKAA